ncbi:MAG: NAD(P)(+) transhydrogenase (Re/Si-specific) subunit beta [Planctomycetota bacterium]|nr:NAD(P)(+) transhydrogenase (Re/Si-specific) subunit beta [Planctomycetota bacterium]
MLPQAAVNLAYLVAAVLFILDLKWMSHPRTAVRGNRAGAIGMLIAVLATLMGPEWSSYGGEGIGWDMILIGLAIGSLIGAFAALKIKMTSMPELVGLFNGFGGMASVLVAAAAIVAAMATDFSTLQPDDARITQMLVATVLSALIGSVTLFGSYVAFGKLAEFLAVKWKLHPWQKAIKYGFILLILGTAGWYALQRASADQLDVYAILVVASAVLMSVVLLAKSDTLPWLNALKLASLLGAIALGIVVVNQARAIDPNLFTTTGGAVLLQDQGPFWALVAVAGLLGVCLTFSIGGADMPVVIALLNSYSGIAAAATGFVINNNALIISGALVGASGIILTNIMCKAMNRSLLNVIFARLGPSADTPDADEVYKNVKSTSADEIAMMLETCERVVIVPGYGMAVAQAQHAVRDFANLIHEKYGCQVEYAVHPVAGRMPGHMNVLLAEANVPYDQLKEMDETNSTIEQADMALVVGANDVVNPVARTDPNSAIAGMPIIDVDRARTVVVIKRSLSPGFAGIPNPLFAMDNTLMFFNDGKDAFVEIIEAVKES